MYTLKVKVLSVSDVTYVGQKNYPKRTFVGETEGKYPQKLEFECFGEKAVNDSSVLTTGTNAMVTFDIKGSEWKERIYVKLSVLSVAVDGQKTVTEVKKEAAASQKSFTETIEDDVTSDLPF
jgi:hypothetical protein